MGAREPLSPERIISAAAGVADRGGLTAVSMRNVGRELSVEAMSLYHHVAGKEALLDGLADWVFAQIRLPRAADSWREGMLRRARSAREVLAAHPWALGLIESRSAPGPALLKHHDAVIGCLHRGGFPLLLASQAFSVIDAYVYGFVLTEQTLPFDPAVAENAGDFARQVAPALAEYPHLAALVGELTTDRDYVFADEFEVGLGMILDQLEHRLASV
ncbi:TetR/AcrR family transcriptional regulator [Leucobacter celer]|uniref:TetR/AcrR family transcriptional regulator n=1 Tax=Leucobacter celer TaxID=668625 RepID=UPI0006A760DA|nr:TetR/AcrR family transcriptional regulator [Leucobacter celer]